MRGPATRPGLRQQAAARLRRYRQGSALAIALTALVLLTWGIDDTVGQVPEAADTLATHVAESPGDAADLAFATVRQLLHGLYRLLPRLGVAAVVLIVGGLLARFAPRLVKRAARNWHHGVGVSALVTVGVWLVTVGTALSVVAGDARALVGSVGLAGLALSWALQTPIESFTGWLLNSFKGYYRVGDRIGVGDVFGDVYRIDILTTTVWEAGAPGKPVQAAQPTGALITFPNNEVLRANIVNYTRDFPYVWDEVTVGIANESDVTLAIAVAQRTAEEIMAEDMREPAARYRELLEAEGLGHEIADRPQVFVVPTDSWLNLVVRYLVPARERRVWSSELVLAIGREFGREEHGGRIITSYPRLQIGRQPD